MEAPAPPPLQPAEASVAAVPRAFPPTPAAPCRSAASPWQHCIPQACCPCSPGTQQVHLALSGVLDPFHGRRSAAIRAVRGVRLQSYPSVAAPRAGWGAFIRTWPWRAQPRPWLAMSGGTTQPWCRPPALRSTGASRGRNWQDRQSRRRLQVGCGRPPPPPRKGGGMAPVDQG